MKKETLKKVKQGRKCCPAVLKEKPCPINVNGIFWCKEHFDVFRPYLWGLSPKWNWAKKLFYP